MEDKDLKIEKLKAAQEKIDRKIQELEGELVLENEEEMKETEDDEVVDISEKKDGWKKVAAIASVVAVAGTGVFFAVRQPWKTAKVVCHLVHIM